MAQTWQRGRQRQQLSPASDAIAARSVLRDCHRSARELLSSTCSTTWRLRWVTTIVLLRAVGHVLHKVDGKRSRYLREAINLEWNRIKSVPEHNLIFHSFIDNERNAIVKEYHVGTRLIRPIKDDVPTDQNLSVLVGDRVLSQQQAISEAIRWWEKLLTEVEFQAAGLRREARLSRKEKVVGKSK